MVDIKETVLLKDVEVDVDMQSSSPMYEVLALVVGPPTIAGVQQITVQTQNMPHLALRTLPAVSKTCERPPHLVHHVYALINFTLCASHLRYIDSSSDVLAMPDAISHAP